MLSLRIRPYWKRFIIRIIYYNSSSNMLMKKLREKYRLERIGLRNYGGLIVTN